MSKRKPAMKAHFRNDILLVAVLLLLCAVGILYLFVFREGGDTVRVTVDGELYGVYSLRENITEEIRTGEDGDQFNLLIIQDGRAFVESASCPDGICVGHRSIFRNGESIVCLPHGVVITVFTDNDKDAPDIVA